MNTSAISSSVAMKALQTKLDILSNNIANVDTVGYKRKDASFSDVLYNTINQPEGFKHQSRLTPLGVPNGFGSRISKITTGWTEGNIKQTDQPFDLAIEGNGLFEVIKPDPSNPNITTSYWTRDGSFKAAMQPNDDQNIYLATSEGYLVMGTDGQPIKIPKDNYIKIDENGNILTTPVNGNAGSSTNVGQIKVMKINKPESLVQVGGNLFSIAPGVSNANGEVLEDATLNQSSVDKIAVRQGFLEQSNVDLSTEMTDLINVQRAFQLNSKALISADAMANIANNLRG